MIPKLVSRRWTFPRTGTLLLACVLWSGQPASAADTQRGANLYARHCAICHGVNGMPAMPGAPNFRRVESLMRPDAQLAGVIRSGRAGMPGYFGVLAERDIGDLVAFLRTLS